MSKAQRGGGRPKPAPAVSIEPAPSPRPAVFGLKRISSCREAGLVFSPNLETSEESTLPDSLLRSSETVLDLSAHAASLVK